MLAKAIVAKVKKTHVRDQNKRFSIILLLLKIISAFTMLSHSLLPPSLGSPGLLGEIRHII